MIRVVILKEDDGSWRAFLCTEAGADVEEIVQAVLDRWAIEQDFHDLKEVERIEAGAVAAGVVERGGVQPGPVGPHADRGVGVGPRPRRLQRPEGSALG